MSEGKQNYITVVISKVEAVFLAGLLLFWLVMGVFGGSVVLHQLFFQSPPVNVGQARFIAGVHKLRQQNAVVETCQGSGCFEVRRSPMVGLRIGPPSP